MKLVTALSGLAIHFAVFLSLYVLLLCTVMGQVASVDTLLMNSQDTVDNNPKLREQVDNLVALAAKSDITPREQKHVDAIKLYADG